MTRKKSRSGAAGKGIAVGIVGAITLIILFYFLQSGGYQFAYGVTRDGVDDLSDQYNNLSEDIDEIDKELIDTRIDILNFDRLIDAAKDKLREVKRSLNDSWDAAVNVREAEDVLQDAQRDYQESRDELFTLLRDKSDIIKLLKELKEQIKADELTLKIQSNIDLSHLVKRIGIVNSKVCITMNQAGINSTCPTYKDLIILDSSITEISGKFTTDDNGYFHRAQSSTPYSYKYYYNDDQLRIFIDPPAEMINRIKLIEIRPNFDTYLDKANPVQKQEFGFYDYIVNKTIGNVTQSETIQVRNQTQEFGRIIYHDRYANAGCTLIIINADKLQMLIADTINYVRNNCDDKHTHFTTQEIIPINATAQDITSTQKYKDDQRLKFIKEHCIFVYGSCPNDY